MPSLIAAETMLSARTRAPLAQAGVAIDGPSPVAAFQDPIGEALAYCGSPPPDPADVTDDDVRRLPGGRWAKFLDVAELRVIETVAAALVNRPMVQRWADYSVGRDLVSFQQYLTEKRKAVRMKWGFGAAPLSPGTIDLNFAAQCRREF